MRVSHARPLKVSTPDGKRIYAKILRLGDNIRIEINYLEVVKQDDPPFAHNGVITISVPRNKYVEIIATLTQYLEDLFLKGMADENIYTSLGVKPKSRGNKKSNSGGEIKSFRGKRDTSSVHISSRGNELAESFRGGETKPEVAESSNSENSGKD